MGRVRIARVLARAGLHLAPTTVRRMLRTPRSPKPSPALHAAPHIISARKPNDLWHVDLTTVPTSLGFWTSWVPFALPQVWRATCSGRSQGQFSVRKLNLVIQEE